MCLILVLFDLLLNLNSRYDICAPPATTASGFSFRSLVELIPAMTHPLRAE